MRKMVKVFGRFCFVIGVAMILIAFQLKEAVPRAVVLGVLYIMMGFIFSKDRNLK